MPRVPRQRLYERDGSPVSGFNALVLSWLAQEMDVREHQTPKAFDLLREAYDLEFQALVSENNKGTSDGHRIMLNNLTNLMFGTDISGQLAQRLSAENINVGGFRTALSQGVAKNSGENFINAVAYALANCLAHQDRILVDKGTPAPIRPLLILTKRFEGRISGTRDISIPIESDLAIWDRKNPHTAIIISAKTRLKER